MSEIDKLRALLEAAIPGPWETRPGGRVARPYMVERGLSIPGRTVCMGSERDARAIAALGTLWPALLAVVKAVVDDDGAICRCTICEEAWWTDEPEVGPERRRALRLLRRVGDAEHHEEWCPMGTLRERIREVIGD